MGFFVARIIKLTSRLKNVVSRQFYKLSGEEKSFWKQFKKLRLWKICNLSRLICGSVIYMEKRYFFGILTSSIESVFSHYFSMLLVSFNVFYIYISLFHLLRRNGTIHYTYVSRKLYIYNKTELLLNLITLHSIFAWYVKTYKDFSDRLQVPLHAPDFRLLCKLNRDQRRDADVEEKSFLFFFFF